MTAGLSDIKLLLLDVDGVLTDGGISYTDSGEQVKTFHSSDGLGLRLLMDAGIEVGIITGRRSDALKHRCDNLGIRILHQGVRDKPAALASITTETGISTQQMAYAGDDLIDLPVMRRVGTAIAVANACEEVKTHAAWVTRASGGNGAVREICEAILKAKALWQDILDRYLS